MALIKRVDNIERYEKKFILVGILAPILGTVLPLSTDSYGKSRFGEC